MHEQTAVAKLQTISDAMRERGGPKTGWLQRTSDRLGLQQNSPFRPGAMLSEQDGIAVATNVESDYQAQPNDAFCSAYNAVRPLVLGLRLPNGVIVANFANRRNSFSGEILGLHLNKC